MFDINHIQQDGLELTELRNLQSHTKIQVLPSFGALWHGWILNKGGSEINLIDHYADLKDLQDNLSISFKGAHMSPFVCRIREGKYRYKGEQYEFKRKFNDGNAIHGLLFDRTFQQGEVKQEEQQISVGFHYNYRQDDAGYPFNYDCMVTYTLHKDNRVTIENSIQNVSEETIPVVDGWHPYFTTGTKVDDCKLQFFSKEVIEFDQSLIPTGNFLPYREFEEERPLKGIELDHSFLPDKNAPQPRCTFSDPQKKIKLHIYPSESYPVLQIYTPPHRNSIAIETLSGAPDAFNNGIGLILLPPGETRVFSVTYEIETDQ